MWQKLCVCVCVCVCKTETETEIKPKKVTGLDHKGYSKDLSFYSESPEEP